MLRHRGQDIQRLRLRQHLGSPKTARNHRHALRNPTRPKVFPYRIAFSLPSSGIVMRDGDSAPGELDLEASLHKFHIDTAGAPPAMTRDDERAFHAEVCGLLDAMEEGTRPSAAHRLLICFAPDYATPFFLWVKTHFDATHGNLSFLFDGDSLVTAWAEGHGLATRTWMVPLAAQRFIFPHPLGHGVGLVGAAPPHDDAAPRDVNWAVQSLGKPGHVTPVFGPVLAFAYATDDHGSFVAVADASLRDLTHAIDALLQAPCHAAPPAPDRARHRHQPALKFADPASPWHRALGAPPVEMATLPCWKRGFPLTVPFSLGLRWIVHPAVVPRGLRASTVWGPDALSKLFGSVVIVRQGQGQGQSQGQGRRGGGGALRGEMVFQRLLFWHGFSVTKTGLRAVPRRVGFGAGGRIGRMGLSRRGERWRPW
ncbi:uncharacterized protein VDAG_02288 [Verticillium dahliae VdLs.17]|uniref:Uncharacterized protein n=1 Tax=Verticillium dahliae (strain VdLs.17 / ATCC MYA-4575 / FGSC 10137) TaxID=498257 RepID=G2WVE7_VERDV|nr:uncharacterized protein VDAG_02288 [Verticillium dahliae VdLs.17]EGY20272.1 hypothetical protein VDAG_02288 [Verticillium dahliae VdLs.17]KAH6685171.1 hypothetical protein EV126DRAFT_487571 [Verticillium dahliae]